MTDWQPTASLETLKTKARLLSKLRAFFADKDVLEVQTPVLSQAGNTTPAIESFVIEQMSSLPPRYFLNTSPEFSMKRLIAAGYGSIYQITPSFRYAEQGSKHNPEFTLLEWYRIGFDHHDLIKEVDELIRYVADGFISLEATQSFSYQEAMQQFAGVNIHKATLAELSEAAEKAGVDVVGMEEASTDDWLDLLMSLVVEKNLPKNCPVFIYDYPANQAALAKIKKGSPDVAERFEIYINGIELANGFYELTDAKEQRQRFEKEQRQRKEAEIMNIPLDENFIAALEHGMPECAGVALGIDRLLMLLLGLENIDEVLTFPFDRA
ncbi:MAG: EF-P lysine aminoacylase EpmA [Woeseiaceae bacterium]